MSEIYDAYEPNRHGAVRRGSVSEVVRLASVGHQDGWDELVRRFGGLVHGVAKRSGLSDNDAADVAQITWLHLIRNIDRLRDPCRIAGWLATTARRESVRLAIGASRQTPCADPVAEYGGASGANVESGADSNLLRGELDPLVDMMLRRLPSPYSRLIKLLISDARLSYAEIAEIIGVPVGSIGPMRLRCLEMLRRGAGLAPKACENAA